MRKWRTYGEVASAESPTPEERRKVEEKLEGLLGPNWRDAPVEETLDVLPHLWRHLRDEFEQAPPSYPRASSGDALSDPFPGEQRMVGAIMEVVLGTTSQGTSESDEPRG